MSSPTTPSLCKTWRDVLPVHPAADLFPIMSEAELQELAKDIKKNGLKLPIILWSPTRCETPDDLATVKDHPQLLDGRNRLDALASNGVRLITDNGKFNWPALRADTVGGLIHISDEDPYNVALSVNIYRRHLTAEQKRDLIAKVLKAKPELSDRAIAKQVKADGKTVAKVRTEQANADIPHKTERTEASGRKARGRKPKPAQKPKPKPKVEQRVFDSPQEARATWNFLVRAWDQANQTERHDFIRCRKLEILRAQHEVGSSPGESAVKAIADRAEARSKAGRVSL